MHRCKLLLNVHVGQHSELACSTDTDDLASEVCCSRRCFNNTEREGLHHMYLSRLCGEMT